ncbi:MAG: hypothetical protein FWD28_08620 [Treponema sp.]|nr:hypothetical protein [Treponema sp.]
MKTKIVCFFGIVLFLVLGCAQPPLEEMESAREAVFRAENDANAVQYAGSTIARARDSLRRMQDEADNKNYDAARAHASDAIASADRAVAEGIAGAQRAGVESDSLISTLKSEIEETSRNINGARYSNLPLDYDSLDRVIVNAYNTSDQAEADQAAGRHQQALDRAQLVRTDLAEANQAVASAAARKK